MTIEFKKESFDSLHKYWKGPEHQLNWPSVFTMPLWQKTWWDSFGAISGFDLLLRSAWEKAELIGIAPLVRRDKTAFLIGSPEVFDYLDYVLQPDREKAFFQAHLTHLKEEGIEKLVLQAQRPDAAAFKGLFSKNSKNFESIVGIKAVFEAENESSEIILPATWEDYLSLLNKKQRHEVRRKLRRLGDETETFSYRVIELKEDVIDYLPRFLELFLQNPEKADFMTGPMENYFNKLIELTAELNMVRFGVLEIDGIDTAIVLYFDYANHIYLYNSGYSSDYASLSVGLLSKVLCIKDSIEKGRRVFDFLKGREVYKSRLGGTAVPIYHIVVNL
ncbi:MAG: GNAT family N-acetyltransferase [Bacillota bacterium]|nr:GNAT family N-acetyltransferase [Bacillota bacterium]